MTGCFFVSECDSAGPSTYRSQALDNSSDCLLSILLYYMSILLYSTRAACGRRGADEALATLYDCLQRQKVMPSVLSCVHLLCAPRVFPESASTFSLPLLRPPQQVPPREPAHCHCLWEHSRRQRCLGTLRESSSEVLQK